MSHIRTAVNTNTPAAQLYLWVIQHIDYRKLTSRTNLAYRNPNANIKAVLFEIDNNERLQCGLTIRDAFIILHGIELVDKIIGEKVYIRRKPVYNTDGTSRLSDTTLQVVASWNSAPPRYEPNYENDDRGSSSAYRDVE
jgi:hypothetical protein